MGPESTYYTRSNIRIIVDSLKLVNKILENTNSNAILIKHRPFPYKHSDIDIVVRCEDLQNILSLLPSIYGTILKIEPYKIHVLVSGSIEIELHLGVGWWDALLIHADDLLKYVDESRKRLYSVYGLDRLEKIKVLSSCMDSFVVLLSRLYQDFSFEREDMLHLIINDDLRGLVLMFDVFGYSRSFVMLLLRYVAQSFNVLRKVKCVDIPLILFLLAQLELLFRARFYANRLSRLKLIARNIVWYMVKKIKRLACLS